MGECVRVGIIGSGGIAQRHLGVLSRERGVEIVGHVTTRPHTAIRAAETWGGRPYTDYRALLEQEVLDAVWICVPPHAHGAVEMALIERQVPFFVEKPLDADGTTSEAVRDALTQSAVLAAVGYHWRALDTLSAVRRVIAENPAKMVLGTWLDATPPPSWWRHQAESGGQMVEQATQLFDLARFLVGDAVQICATGAVHQRSCYPDADVADVSAAVVRFDNDVVGVFSATCALANKVAVQLQIVCEGLLVSITPERVIFDTGDEQWDTTAKSDPFAVEDRAFLAALREDRPEPILCTYDDALSTHRLCWAIQTMAQRTQDI